MFVIERSAARATAAGSDGGHRTKIAAGNLLFCRLAAAVAITAMCKSVMRLMGAR
jgi:hypothetical protein